VFCYLETMAWRKNSSDSIFYKIPFSLFSSVESKSFPSFLTECMLRCPFIFCKLQWSVKKLQGRKVHAYKGHLPRWRPTVASWRKVRPNFSIKGPSKTVNCEQPVISAEHFFYVAKNSSKNFPSCFGDIFSRRYAMGNLHLNKLSAYF
jgi:hypothetical protein